MNVGFLTIGQSPRIDIIRDIDPILKRSGIEYAECGALDNLTTEQIRDLKPQSSDDYILVTRLRDGSEVKLSKEKIVQLLQNCIDKLEKQVEVFGLFCTGEFPELKSNKLLIEPSILLSKVVEALSKDASLTIIIPSQDQETELRKKWNNVEEKGVVSISPYTSKMDDFKKKLDGLQPGNLVVMDCMGYTSEMKRTVEKILNRPVILPRTLLATVIGEIAH
jgi:protein AroM